MADPNRENRSIDFMTKRHGGGRPAKRSLVSMRSKGGGFKRDSHFTTSEPERSHLPKSDFSNNRTTGTLDHVVFVGGVEKARYHSHSQALSVANSMGGHVKTVFRGEGMENSPAQSPRLPMPNPENYSVVSTTLRWFIPTGETRTTKKGEVRPVLIPNSGRKVRVVCLRSGLTFFFTGSHRGGVWKYTDSRDERRRPMNEEQFRAEISKFADVKVVLAGFEMVMTPAEFKELPID